MTFWQSVQRIGRQTEFLLDEKEEPRGEADGTGIGITGIAKRGKELKVLVQYKKGGGIRVAWLGIGHYNGSWEKLFRQNLEIFKNFARPFLLVTDGDTAIFESIKGKGKFLIQWFLWHIPYQAQYVLWKDEVARKSTDWLHVVAERMKICAIRSLVDCPETIQAVIASKRGRLNQVIEFCFQQNYAYTVAYLENSRGDMFTALENRLNGKTTSRVERLMRTAQYQEMEHGGGSERNQDSPCLLRQRV
jgi:hypothetical protein